MRRVGPHPMVALSAYVGALVGCASVSVRFGAEDAVPDPVGAIPSPVPACAKIVVSTLAGNGSQGWNDGTGGPQGTTEFNDPRGVVVDPSGFIYVMEGIGQRIRRIAPDGTTTTLTGNGNVGLGNGTGGSNGTTTFSYAVGLAEDGAGNLYVADTFNNVIRRVKPDGSATTFSGSSANGFADGPPNKAMFNLPQFVAVDGAGYVYVTDLGNNRIRKLAPDGTAKTLAGNGRAGFADGTGGTGGTATFNRPNGLVVSASGTVYVADELNRRIRRIDPDGTTTTVVGNGTDGYIDGTGGPHGTTEFLVPNGLALDTAGNLYVADGWDYTFGPQGHGIRKVAPDGTTATMAGGVTAGFQDGTSCDALFHSPSSIAVAGKTLVVTDGDNRVRMITLP